MGKVKTNSFKIIIAAEAINFRNILAGKLRVDNFEVEFVTGGFHMLHLIEHTEENINMIIINEDMHDMSAQEMISLVRLSKSKTELPILFISRSSAEADICELVFTGANEYVVQTDNFNPILERAHKYLHILKPNAA